jgi:hypothetical protein
LVLIVLFFFLLLLFHCESRLLRVEGWERTRLLSISTYGWKSTAKFEGSWLLSQTGQWSKQGGLLSRGGCCGLRPGIQCLGSGCRGVLFFTLLGVLGDSGRTATTHHALHLFQLKFKSVYEVGDLFLTDFIGQEVQRVPLPQVVNDVLSRRLRLKLP